MDERSRLLSYGMAVTSAKAILAVGGYSLLFCASATGQEPPNARLTYSVDSVDACPDEATFRDIVASRLGYDPFQPSAAMRIEVCIEQSGTGHVGSVRALRSDASAIGERKIDTPEPDCQQLATTLAVALSIMLDPFGESAHVVTEVSADPPPRPAPSITEDPPDPPVSDRASLEEDDVDLVLAGGINLGFGSAPGFTLGLNLGLGLRVHSLSLLAEGRIDLMPTDATTSSRDRVEATLFSGGPTACLSVEWFLGCGSYQLGVFQGRALDVIDSRIQTSTFMSADFRGGVSVPISTALSFHALGELRVPIIRTALSIDSETVWRAPPLAGAIRLELGVTIL